jgi:uncharacterized protein YyaL (SSP411 family)
MKRALALLLFIYPAIAADSLNWQPWSDDIFARAKQQDRLVLLDLEAVWCHWCHVMAETTYKDPATVALLQQKYLLIRVDQDSRPDISHRYEDYGWPATVIFDANGKELVKRQGYIEPAEMARLLKAVIDDPTPKPSVVPEKQIEFATSAQLPDDLRTRLRARYLAGYDRKHGSWGFSQKYLDWDSVELAIAMARQGDANAAAMARKTLDEQFHLIDPVWGGVYQYSTGGNWKEPHFEKIMKFQAENLRVYSIAYSQWRTPEYRNAALDIHRFLHDFLTAPEGGFYTSMDADLVDGEHSASYFKLDNAGRRKLGIPRVDRHVYARENGWAIEAVVTLYEATGDPQYLSEARRAAEWIIANRSLDNGGFRHDAQDVSGPYLGDTLAMSRAFLKLYEATADRQWLTRAAAGLGFIAANFHNAAGAGFLTSRTATDAAYRPEPEHDENLSLARFANLMASFTGNTAFRDVALEAMRFAVTPDVATEYTPAGLLLADLEMTHPPVHITVVGPKSDPEARNLFLRALTYPTAYRRVEWLDRSEGTLPNSDVDFPVLPESAAFLCSGTSCSRLGKAAF